MQRLSEQSSGSNLGRINSKMANNWTWEFDESDEEVFTDFSEMPQTKQHVGMLAIDKMKISDNNEDQVQRKTVDLCLEQETVEELRAYSIEYKEGLDQNCKNKYENWEEENKSRILFQGKIPIFIGSDYFYVSPMVQSKEIQTKQTMELESKTAKQ